MTIRAALAFSREPLEWRVVVQIVTIAKFRRPRTPKNCNIHAYHVWRWQTRSQDPNQQPIDGMKCRCGCLTWTFRPKRLSATPEPETQ